MLGFGNSMMLSNPLPREIMQEGGARVAASRRTYWTGLLHLRPASTNDSTVSPSLISALLKRVGTVQVALAASKMVTLCCDLFPSHVRNNVGRLICCVGVAHTKLSKSHFRIVRY